MLGWFFFFFLVNYKWLRGVFKNKKKGINTDHEFRHNI